MVGDKKERGGDVEQKIQGNLAGAVARQGDGDLEGKKRKAGV